MQHNVTATITEALNAGITWDDIDARINTHTNTIVKIGAEYVVYNRADEALIERVIPEMIAHKVHAPAAGTFTKAAGVWGVRVAAADYQEGRAVVITKRDGSSKDATLGRILETRGGHVVAAFTEGFPAPADTEVEAETTVETAAPAPVAAPATTVRRRRRIVRSALYGTGVRYDDMPGATHYGDAQIWDNA